MAAASPVFSNFPFTPFSCLLLKNGDYVFHGTGISENDVSDVVPDG